MFTARNTAVLVSSAATTYNQTVAATCGTTATIAVLVYKNISGSIGIIATLVAGITGVSAIAQSTTVALIATFQKQVNKILTAEA